MKSFNTLARCALAWSLLAMSSISAWAVDPAKFPGTIVDDSSIELTGKWTDSNKVAPYVGQGYRFSAGGEKQKAVFPVKLPAAGDYEVFVAYTTSGNRSDKVPVILATGPTPETITINQRSAASFARMWEPLGRHCFPAETSVTIDVENASPGVVIVDAVWFLTVDQLAEVKKNQPDPAPAIAAALPNNPAEKKPAEPKKMAQAKPEKKEKPPESKFVPAPPFVRIAPSKPKQKLDAEALDRLLDAEIGGGILSSDTCDDTAFIRRVTLDVIGRVPSTEEITAFLAAGETNKREALVERLLASPEFGANWGNYWSDVISFRTPQPELTFLNYVPFKKWLGEEFNRGVKWDEIVYKIVTAGGKVGDHPEATFVGFHQADRSRLASETTRVFLSTQIQCAECHDHKFIDLSQTTFHHVAAYFARVEAKLPHNDSNLIEVKSKAAGEHKLPAKGGGEMNAAAWGANPVEVGADDLARRTELAEWLTSPENPWFAKAFVNRVWARLMGRGFSEPVDEIGELGDHVLPKLFDAVAEHFGATEYDPKELFRTIVLSKAYQRPLVDAPVGYVKPFSKLSPGRLRGDEVFDSLVVGLELPNITPEAKKPTTQIRFPPPPKSTRDLVNDAFGYDPSLAVENVNRTMQQAMFMMNNKQLQAQVDARAESDTLLAKLLAETQDDNVVLEKLYRRLLARSPSENELAAAKEHIASLKDRGTAFEDLLWAILNSAEFTSRR